LLITTTSGHIFLSKKKKTSGHIEVLTYTRNQILNLSGSFAVCTNNLFIETESEYV